MFGILKNNYLNKKNERTTYSMSKNKRNFKYFQLAN